MPKQALRRSGEFSASLDADRQPPQRPPFGQPDGRDARRPRHAPGRGLGNDADARARAGHPADRIKAAQRDAIAQPHPQRRGLRRDVILQRAAGQPDEIAPGKFGQADLPRPRQRIILRRDDDPAAGQEAWEAVSADALAGDLPTTLAEGADGRIHAGVNGYVYPLATSSADGTSGLVKMAEQSLRGAGYQQVSLLRLHGRLFAGSGGYVYELDPATGAYGTSGIHRERLELKEPFPIDIDLTAVNRRRPDQG